MTSRVSTQGAPGAGDPDEEREPAAPTDAAPKDGAATDGAAKDLAAADPAPQDFEAKDSAEAQAPAEGSDKGAAAPDAPGRSRRPPAVTTDTARPEGGGRAAPGDAPAPARQWPLLTVLGLTALGLFVVGTDLFPQSFRVGGILVGVALLTGAGLRRALPSVGMLAVRSRFTDMVTYGVMGGLIVLLALMVQPAPWLRIPFLEDILHLTIT
ncbi:DUF3017 domain-containing protein [Streptomyces sp. NPDC003035]|uniref:DUF3017 domain-containing protein n=1 Tax=Streptomyces sp. NPDC003035 TaxID=3364676 RepID=UPI0036853F76